MRRRRIDEESEKGKHDRWLVSYADFVTLLFAFFVVLFASSRTDQQRVEAAGASLRRAFHSDRTAASVVPSLKVADSQEERAGQPAGGHLSLDEALTLLESKLSADVQAGHLTLKLESRGLVISLREASYFVSGDDSISEAAYPVLEKIAATIASMSNAIRLEGHTDPVPIHNSRFRSNWELSSARAIAMLEALRTRFGIPGSRMAVAGYADSSPVASNDSEEGRAKNRRVDLVVLTPTAAR